MADDAGALLVRTGLIDDQALLAARAARVQGGGTIGEQLVLAGALTDEALTEFYRSRLLVPRVNPNTLARLPANVVEAIPADMSIEFRAIPVSLDRDGNLTVAMSDPSDRHAVDEIGFFTGKYVVRAVATQMQIAWCLAHYYGHITELGRRLLKPTSAGPAIAPASAPATPEPIPRVRGFTGRVEATRHKVLPPVADGDAAPAPAPRPSDELLTPTAEDLARIKAAEAAPAPIAPESSGPYEEVVSLLDVDEEPPTPMPPKTVRRRPAEPDPPELAARSGELEAQERPAPEAHLSQPAVVVSLDDDDDDDADDADDADTDEAPTPRDDEPAIIHDPGAGDESQPILLVSRRPARDTLPDTDEDEDEEEPVLLERRKPPSDPPPRRKEKRTQVGVGIPERAPSTRPWAAATPADGVPRPVPAGRSEEMTRPHAGPATTTIDDPDEGWGPPGTTIPPPFLGAMPGTEPTPDDAIPIAGADEEDLSTPLVVAPVAPAAPAAPQSAARELEVAATRLVELLRQLDRATTRDEVIDALLAYLALSHDRVAFLALKNAALTPFQQRPPSPHKAPTLSLEEPSTLQDVVGTRLPYRGTLGDEPSRAFLTEAFGVPPGEVLILPVAVRERVVAVLYGDGRAGHSFDEHFAIAGRAAGLALERILQHKRASTQP